MSKRPKAGSRPARRPAPRRLGRPPGQPSEDTRRRILLAARECFAELGFERATNREIAAAAGLTAAAIYRHFDSKPELYRAVVREAIAELVPVLRAAVSGAASARAALQALVRAHGKLGAGQRAAVRFLAAIPTEMQRYPQVSQLMLAEPGEVYAIVNDVIAAGVRDGEIPRDSAPQAVALVIAMLMGLSAYAATLGQTYSELAIEGLVELLEGQLFSARRKASRGAR